MNSEVLDPDLRILAERSHELVKIACASNEDELKKHLEKALSVLHRTYDPLDSNLNTPAHSKFKCFFVPVKEQKPLPLTKQTKVRCPFDDEEVLDMFLSAKKSALRKTTNHGDEYRFFKLGSKTRGSLVVFTSGAVPSVMLEAVREFAVGAYANIQSVKKLKQQIYLDEVTGLFNYRYLNMCLDREIKRCRRFNKGFCVVFVDVDDFKQVNDHCGHQIGNEALNWIAQKIKAELRDIDLVFRYGGDEFVVILLETNPNEAYNVCQRIRQTLIEDPFCLDQSQVEQGTADDLCVPISVSIGFSAYPLEGKDRKSLLSIADTYMYEAKNLGKNQIVSCIKPPKGGLSIQVRPGAQASPMKSPIPPFEAKGS